MMARLRSRTVSLRHVAHWPTYWPLLAWIVVLAAVGSAGTFQLFPLLMWAGIHAVGLVGAGALVLAIMRSLEARGDEDISVAGLLALGALAGAAKALGTSGVEAALGLPGSSEALFARALGAVVAGMWLLTTVALARSGLENLSRARTELVAHNVAARLSERHGSFRPELTQTLEALQELRSRFPLGDKQLTSHHIREVVDSTVRPFSRALWAVEERRYPAPTMMSLYRAALYALRPEAAVIAAFWALMSVTTLIPVVGALVALVYSLCVAVGAFLAFSLLRLGRTRSVAGSLAAVMVAAVLAVGVGFVIARAVSQQVGEVVSLPLLVAGAVWMTLVAIGSSMIFAARDLRRVVLRDLASQGTQSLIVEQSDAAVLKVSSIALSRHLHGLVQSRLLGLAAAIEHRNLSIEDVDAEVSKIAQQLTTLADTGGPPESPSGNTAEGDWRGLVQDWRGMVEIECAEKSWPVLAHLLKSAPESFEILREAVTNSYRHGSATAVQVSASADSPSTFTLRVVDNGYGPRSGAAGLGTTLLNAWTAGHFTLAAAAEGGAELVATLRCEVEGSQAL